MLPLSFDEYLQYAVGYSWRTGKPVAITVPDLQDALKKLLNRYGEFVNYRWEYDEYGNLYVLVEGQIRLPAPARVSSWQLRLYGANLMSPASTRPPDPSSLDSAEALTLLAVLWHLC